MWSLFHLSRVQKTHKISFFIKLQFEDEDWKEDNENGFGEKRFFYVPQRHKIYTFNKPLEMN